MMADDVTTVGTIELDVELSEKSIEKEMEGLKKAFSSNDLTAGFKDSLDSFIKELNDFVKKDITNLTNSIKESMNELAELNKPPEIDVTQTENKFLNMFRKINIFARDSINKATGNIRNFGQMGKESVDNISNSMDNATSKAKEFSEEASNLGIKADTDSTESKFFNMFKRLNIFSRESVNKINNDFKSFSQTGVDSGNQVVKGMKQLQSELEKTEMQINETKDSIERLSYGKEKFGDSKDFFPKVNYDDAISRYETQLAELESKAEVLKQEMGQLGNEIEGVGDSTQSTGKRFSVFTKIIGGIGQKAKKVTPKIRLFGDEMKKSGNKTNGFAAMINKSFKSILRRLFIYNLILKGIRGIMNYTGAALKTNQQFVHSLNVIKTNLMVAFQPIYDFVLPALNALMRGIATATTYIATAISALFGKTYKQSFNAAKNLDNTKKAMSGYGKAAKKAGKEAKGALMSFDEINPLDKKDNADDTDGGGGAGDFEMVMPPESMFDAFDDLLGDPYAIGKKVGEWITKGLSSINWESIKKHASNIGKNIALFINGGIDTPQLWYQMGRTIGEGLNTVVSFVESFADTLNWSGLGKSLANGLNSAIDYWDPKLAGMAIYKGLNGIREVIYNFFTETDWGSFGDKFATGLNTIVTGLDMDMIGRSFASKWNALTDFMYEFISEFDWTTLGSQLSVGINSWFDEIDWAKAGTTLSDGIKGILEVVNTFVIETDWFQIGKSLADIIANIDWAGIISLLFQGIGAALGGLAQFIWGLISDAWQSVVDWWSDAAYEDGQFTIKGLLQGILEGVKNIGNWIKDNILKPFIDGFKSAFGIHSPSTVMQEMGTFLMQGLINGIKELVDKVVEIFTDIKNKMSEVWDNAKKKTEEVWNAIKTFLIEKIWNPIKNTAQNIWEGIKKVILDPIQSAWTKLKEIWDKIKGYILKKWNEIKEGISSMKDKLINAVLEPFKIVDGKIKGIIGNAKNWGKNLIGNFTDGIKSMVGKVKDAASNVAGAVKDRIGFHSPTKEGPGSDADKWMPNMMQMFADGIQDNIYEVSTAVSATAGSIQQGMQPNTDDMATSISSAIYQSMQGLNSSGGDMTIVVKVGEDTLTNKVVSSINRQNRINGETVITV